MLLASLAPAASNSMMAIPNVVPLVQPRGPVRPKFSEQLNNVVVKVTQVSHVVALVFNATFSIDSMHTVLLHVLALVGSAEEKRLPIYFFFISIIEKEKRRNKVNDI